MIYLKINKTEQNEVVAICDSDLIGKSFSEKGLILKVIEHKWALNSRKLNIL